MRAAVIFDLDGTLWDATAAMVAPWNDVLRRHGREPLFTRRVMAGLMGRTACQIAAFLAPDDPEEGLALVYESCRQELPVLLEKGGVLYPGVADTLPRLAQTRPLAIVSNCQQGYIEAFLTHHRLAPFFADHLCEGDTRLTKGDNIRRVMAQNGWESAVYVGDTAGDLAAADAAGVPFIHAAYGFGQVERAIPAIERFDQLPDCLAAMGY
ncbi:MAG: HAD family hydrolase [Acutalibacteraceae bacterium]|jgi:phosphoglycolate phosphatase